MPLFTWDDTYSVKVARCDNDHKKLFSFINDLHDAMAHGKGADAVQHTVQQLLDYTKSHFSAEEALMEKAGYADLPAHRAQHEVFVKQIQQFQKELQTTKTGKAVAVIEFLKEWLLKHIMQTDKRYSADLNAHGIK